MIHWTSPFNHSINNLNVRRLIIENKNSKEIKLVINVGSGIKTINSISKITKMIAIIKNWLENLKFLEERELKPHSTLAFWEKLIL